MDIENSFDVDPNFDADSLIGEAESNAPSSEISMGSGGEVDWSKIDLSKHWDKISPMLEKMEFEYAAAGKTVKEPFEMLKKRASMGYDYAQKLEQFNKEKGEWEPRVQWATEAEAKWKPLDEYARANPQWQEFIQDQWNKRQQFEMGQFDPNDPIAAKINQLQSTFDQKLGNMETQVKTLAQERQRQQQQAEDAALDVEIKSVREKYSDIDFEQRDEFGKSLEMQVLEHAQRLGLTGKSAFKAAFHDFYLDKLVARERDKAREGEVKKRAELKKQGFIGQSTTPTMRMKPAQDVRSKSWDQLGAEALDEINQGRY